MLKTYADLLLLSTDQYTRLPYTLSLFLFSNARAAVRAKLFSCKTQKIGKSKGSNLIMFPIPNRMKIGFMNLWRVIQIEEATWIRNVQPPVFVHILDFDKMRIPTNAS